jgi:hypothetical protein
MVPSADSDAPRSIRTVLALSADWFSSPSDPRNWVSVPATARVAALS